MIRMVNKQRVFMREWEEKVGDLESSITPDVVRIFHMWCTGCLNKFGTLVPNLLGYPVQNFAALQHDSQSLNFTKLKGYL